MAKNNNTLVFNGLMQGMSWDLIKEAKDEIKRHLGEKLPTRKDILTDWIVGKDYMLLLQGKSYQIGGNLNFLNKGFNPNNSGLYSLQLQTNSSFDATSDNRNSFMNGSTNNGNSFINNASQIGGFIGMFDQVGGNAYAGLSNKFGGASNDIYGNVLIGDVSSGMLGGISNRENLVNSTIDNILSQELQFTMGDNASIMALSSLFKPIEKSTSDAAAIDTWGWIFLPGLYPLLGESAVKSQKRINLAADYANARSLANLNAASTNAGLLNTLKLLQQYTNKNGGKLKKSHKFAEGGLLNNYFYGLDEINAGGSHEENPNEGVVVSYAPDGLPNKVEEGETIHNDYVYSKRLEANEKVLENNLLDKKYEGKSFADISKKLTEDRKKRPNDPISVRTNEENLNRLQGALEELKLDNKTKEVKRFLGSLNNDLLNALQLEMMDEYEAYAELLAQQLEQEDLAYQKELAALEGIFGRGGHLGLVGMKIKNNKYKFYNPLFLEEETPYNNLTEWYIDLIDTTPNYTIGKDINTNFNLYNINNTSKDNNKNNNSSLAPLRFAEAFGSAGLYLSDILGLTNLPDYSNARMYQRTIDNIGGVNFTPIGNYLTYTPIDTEYLANQQMATAAARRNYGNIAGNYTLGLLGDYNTLNQIGATAMAARQQDLEQRNKVAEFNRATNDRNSAMSLDAQKQNAALRALRALEYRYLADMMTKERDINEAARAANYQNFISNVAAIGREDFNYDQIKWMIDHGVFPVGAESYLTGLKI